jgi:putative transposase
MDFVSDSLANGRRIKCLTVADDFSHECVDIADYGISGSTSRGCWIRRPSSGATRGRAHRQRPGVHQPGLHGWAQSHGIRTS